jgi:hypothetical protein
MDFIPEQLKHLRKIPESFVQEQFPAHNLSIKPFLEFNLPPTSLGISIIHASHCFSTQIPNDDACQLMSHQLPNQEWVKAADNMCGQAILDGKKSIKDPS